MNVLSDGGVLPPLQRRLVLWSVLIGTSLVVLDGGLVNVALPTLSEAFGVNASSAVWVLIGHQLATAVCIIPSAALGQRYGMRNVYMWGIALFAISAFACVLAPTFELLVAARVLQGGGGAMIVALGMALIRQAFPDHALGPILGWYAMVVAVGNASSPILGGLLLGTVGWQWVFACSILPGLASAMLIARSMPNHAWSTLPLDLRGFVYVGIAMAAFVVALDSLPSRLGLVAVLLLVFVTFAWAFVQRQSQIPAPALHLDIFADGRFSFAVVTSFLSFSAHTLALIAFVYLMEFGQDRDPLSTALMLSPWPLATALAAPIAGRLCARVAAFWLATGGLVCLSYGLWSLSKLPLTSGSLEIMLNGAICGFGFGFFQSPNNREMMGRAARERSGSAAAVLAATRTIAMSSGAALAGVFLANADVSPSKASLALAAAALIASIGAIVSLSRRRFAH